MNLKLHRFITISLTGCCSCLYHHFRIATLLSQGLTQNQNWGFNICRCHKLLIYISNVSKCCFCPIFWNIPQNTWAVFHNLIQLMSPEPLNRGESIYWDIQMDSHKPRLFPSLKQWRWRDVTEISYDSAKMRLTNILMRKCQPCPLVPNTQEREEPELQQKLIQ